MIRYFKRFPTSGTIVSLFLLISISCTGGRETETRSSSTGHQTDLRLITHNVWYGFTKKPERKEAWLEWMQQRRPDVVALQELNGYTPEQLGADAANWKHPHSALLKTEGFPTGITSRYPITDVRRIFEGFHHGLLRARIEGIYFYVIHLHPGNWETRYREAGLILKDIEQLPEEARVVLAGDFNALSPLDSVRYSDGRLVPFFRRLSERLDILDNNLNNGRLDYSVIGRFRDAGLADLTYRSRPDDYSFTGSYPTVLVDGEDHGDPRRIDYVFASNPLSDFVSDAAVISNDTTQHLSDHLPVVVDLQFQ